MLVNGKVIFKFKAFKESFNFLTQFFLRSISNGFGALGNVYYFSVSYNPIDKPNILNIHKYLMIKNNV